MIYLKRVTNSNFGEENKNNKWCALLKVGNLSLAGWIMLKGKQKIYIQHLWMDGRYTFTLFHFVNLWSTIVESVHPKTA